VGLFERKVAQFAGAKFGVAVDCCTHALELSLRYLNAKGRVALSRHTYPSVPMMLLQLGCELEWSGEKWQGAYRLDPYPVVDASLRFAPGMHRPGDFTCLSFQHKKRIGIGRGGMILLDDEKAYRWLKKACHDGREPGLFWHDDDIDMMGWHYYMTPDDAARGLLLFEEVKEFADQGGWERYPDISRLKFFAERAGKA
jgi:dTDP-4-amino-4,6-dideoxygalactose transaminase